jgi:Phage-related lysozyme (muraminidase)
MSVDTTTARHVTQAGLDLIKSFEGCRLKAYKCPAGIWTCGYGSTGPDVGPDTEWTQDQAVARLASDLNKFEHGVAALLTADASNAEFSAMVCLSYNIGLGNFGKSSVLRLHNQSDRKGAADAFLMWTKAGGKELPGLVRRRAAERSLYLS